MNRKNRIVLCDLFVGAIYSFNKYGGEKGMACAVKKPAAKKPAAKAPAKAVAKAPAKKGK